MKSRTRTALAAAALILATYGCSSSTDRGGGPDAPGGRGLRGLLERHDTLLFSGVHSRYSLSAEGETVDSASVEAVSCEGAGCIAGDGTTIRARDLIDPSAVVGVDAADESRRGSRGGFDTVTLEDSFEIVEMPSGITVTAALEVTNYGFWGEHGFAAVTIGTGPLSGEIGGTPITGEFGFVNAYAMGDATGTNPAGMGSATWRGIAEAASTGGTFERHQGSATVTIADLSQPRVGVAIDVPGHDIGAPGWSDMALSGGHFTAGTAASDYLAGNFHGPDHDEAWGVFDTEGYVGAFGAKRQR